MFADFAAITVGDSRSLVRTITAEDVRRFVDMTGDDNPLHVDPAFAETTAFKDVVVHGMLGASFLSTVIGTQLPGTGALWLSQNMEFLLPVRLGDELTVSATVVGKHERDRLLDLDTRIVNQNQQLVLSGQGRVKVLTPSAPAVEDAPRERPRVAIVTGGAGGIGRAVCRRLAADGLHVVVNYHQRADRAADVTAEINAGGGSRALAVGADISTDAGAEALFRAAVREFGAVDVLVNNASPRINPKPLATLGWADVQAQLDVSVKGALAMTRAVAPGMGERGWGRIVNVTSQVLDGPPSSTWTGYAMAKGALAVFSRYMAAELGPQGITVNCVAPGMTETPLIGDVPEKVQLMAARQTPLRRLARPADVAAAVAYLVSDDAAFITGDTVAVNGGSVMR
ncbi:SDR family oxidoreductase [Modestobacter sp. VKM Ac-2985]|uniref:SDR family oxidoreductase n=1 Tax=Modestobacter sp. VKM Ac-2985 TaxID=3004139 RepID=UPI0022AB80E2|nr:SDR family oxidoreductase [Modestobacter sp. VKM Ac-2985]MCZ2836539.1 SDR family oxidoreductase [Modestobacter sp. VKM Ac-2985]